MNHTPPHLLSRRNRNGNGFTLVEMAVVVLLMGIVLTMGLSMLKVTQENAAWSETRLKQDRIKAALIGFFRTNGRLPCPDSALPPTGVEPAACLGAAGRGVPPWRVLGLSVGDVQDGWSNFISYRVANATPVTSRNWTLKAGATAFSLRELTVLPATVSLSYQERSDAGALGGALTPYPVVMLISHGKNGAGARTVRGTALMPMPAGADELANANTASTAFVMRTPTDVAAAPGGAFDDVVTYMTPSQLFQPMLDDKTLKGQCQAYCAVAAPGCVAAAIPIGLPNPTCP